MKLYHGGNRRTESSNTATGYPPIRLEGCSIPTGNNKQNVKKKVRALDRRG